MAQRDELFMDVPPYLFRMKFVQKCKEQVKKMGAIKVTIPPLKKQSFFGAGSPRTGRIQPGGYRVSKPCSYKGGFKGKTRPPGKSSHAFSQSRKDQVH